LNQQDIQHNLHQLRTAWKWFLCGLRWLSIILFGVLFFVGIYFKLPVKALVGLAVIPVVGLFVPKKIQPWVWLSLTVLLISLFGWLHLPEHNSRQWQPYQFDGELDALENGSPITGQNAAELYQQVLQEYGETIFYFRFADDTQEQQTLTHPWDPAQYPKLDFWITALEPALQKLTEAARLDQCRFDIPHNIPSMNPQLGRLNQLKGWARLLLRASARDLYNGLHPQALQKQLAVIGIARHLYQQKTLLDQSAAFQVELLGTRALEKYIIDHGTDPKELACIEQTFAGLDPHWAGNWPHILAREKLQSKNLFGLLYETDTQGRIRISHSAMMALQEGLGYQPRRLFLNQQTMNRLAVLGLWICLPSDPQKMADMVNKRFDYYSLQIQKGTEFPQMSLRYIWILGLNAQSIVDWLAMQRVGYYWALNGQFTRHQAVVNRIHILSAIKQFYLQNHRWPERLEEIKIEDAFMLFDPLNNKPFRYERTDEGFRFYSLGPNGIDDGGFFNSETQKDDIQIWPKDFPQADENGQKS
jgi:hypothetical protein